MSTSKEKISNDEKEQEEKENKKENISELSPEQRMFHYARAGLLDELKDLKKSHSNLNINIADTKNGREEGWYGGENTALHYCCQYGHLPVAKFLLGQESSIDTKNKLGNTPLHVASSNGRTEIVEYLLQNKFSVNTKNKIGNTPLHCSVYAGHVEVTKLLLNEIDDPTQALQEGNLCGLTPVKYCSHEDMKNFLRQFFRRTSNTTPKLLEEDEIEKLQKQNSTDITKTTNGVVEIDDNDENDDDEEPVVVDKPSTNETNEKPNQTSENDDYIE